MLYVHYKLFRVIPQGRGYKLKSVYRHGEWNSYYKPSLVSRPNYGLFFTYLTMETAILMWTTSMGNNQLENIQLWYCLTYHTKEEETIFPLLNAGVSSWNYASFWKAWMEQKSDPYVKFHVKLDETMDMVDDVAGVSEIMPVCPVHPATFEKKYTEPSKALSYSGRGLSRWAEHFTRRDNRIAHVKNMYDSLVDEQKPMWEEHIYSHEGDVTAKMLKNLPMEE